MTTTSNQMSWRRLCPLARYASDDVQGRTKTAGAGTRRSGQCKACDSGIGWAVLGAEVKKSPDPRSEAL